MNLGIASVLFAKKINISHEPSRVHYLAREDEIADEATKRQTALRLRHEWLCGRVLEAVAAAGAPIFTRDIIARVRQRRTYVQKAITSLSHKGLIAKAKNKAATSGGRPGWIIKR